MPHPLRKTIVRDLWVFITLSTKVGEKNIDKVLEKIATMIYPVLKRSMVNIPVHMDKICVKCNKYHVDAKAMGQGVICPICLEKLSVKGLLNAKIYLAQKGQARKFVCNISGESISDLWGEFGKQCMTRKFVHFKHSRYWKSRVQYMCLVLDGKELSITK